MKISVVTTLYYSESYVAEFYKRISNTVRQITDSYEIIFVNDGSPDNAASEVLNLQQHDTHVVLVELSRNFGHHQAIVAGLQQAMGDFVFLIDSDLEEDPELLLLFWRELTTNSTTDVVYGIQERRKGNFFERISGGLFYKIVNAYSNFNYPVNTLTARLMKKGYVDAVLKFPEKTLDVWAVFILAGFKQMGIPVTKASKGASTYTFSKKLRMSLEIITSISHRPLYLIFFLGLIWFIISLINVSVILVKKWIYGVQIEGWASIMASIWLIGGIVIFSLGVISIYLSKVFIEMKNRPLSIVKEIYRKQNE